jgi:hypothetical protein
MTMPEGEEGRDTGDKENGQGVREQKKETLE